MGVVKVKATPALKLGQFIGLVELDVGLIIVVVLVNPLVKLCLGC